jgi:hypothetical protein
VFLEIKNIIIEVKNSTEGWDNKIEEISQEVVIKTKRRKNLMRRQSMCSSRVLWNFKKKEQGKQELFINI